jgi:hypothetical protein
MQKPDTSVEQDQSPDAIARRELINRTLDGARGFNEQTHDAFVQAINLDTDELLIETGEDFRVVPIREYLAADQVTIVPDTFKHGASYAKFDHNGRYRIIPLGSNVGEALPLRAGGGA